MKEIKVKIEFSNRHIHLSKELLEKLFGEGYELKSEKKLSQADDFASTDTLEIVGPGGSIKDVRIVGPVREKTQVEILLSDAHKLGIDVPVKLSEDFINTPGIKIIGPFDEVDLESGVIVAKRHLHISEKDASEYGIKQGDVLRLKIDGERGLVFDNIIARVSEDFHTMIHLDIEEANSAGIKQQQSEGTLLID